MFQPLVSLSQTEDEILFSNCGMDRRDLQLVSTQQSHKTDTLDMQKTSSQITCPDK